jgi:AAA15 family ATPase/GTPase
MLASFSTKGFKNFGKEICLKLDDIKNYEFSTNAVKDDIVKTALIYGANGSGKTNLGYAIFDIITHLTDKQRHQEDYSNYLNLDSGRFAEFSYKFKFDRTILEYFYSKKDFESLLTERLDINGETVISYDHKTHSAMVKLAGAETLNTNLEESNLSFVKYIAKNTVLEKNAINRVFQRFMNFVDNMLLFSSLDRNYYQGFKTGAGRIPDGIIKANKLKDFEAFLESNGIKYNLTAKDVNGQMRIFCKFKKTAVDFYAIASRGTSSLALFYYWLMLLDKIPFVFIDEFDAFYHSGVSRSVVEAVMSWPNTQGVFTTHNTDIMTNDLLRPDCYFQISENGITSFSDSTDKELRKAHNLQKMYKAGAFNANVM